MAEVSGVTLDEVSRTEMEATFSVAADGHRMGTVTFWSWYEPAIKAIGAHVALWAGSTLCVIDRQRGTMRCMERDDETHRVHEFEHAWVIEGELTIDLFAPASGMTLARYSHNEVITDSSVVDGLVHVQDFAGVTITLDPRRALRVVARGC